MIVSFNTTKWYERMAAAFIHYTSLPLSAICKPGKKSFDKAIEFWPLTGWLTGGLASAIIWFGSAVVPQALAVGVAVVARMLLTKGMHEDGLRRFSNAFARGKTAQQIVAGLRSPAVGLPGAVALAVYFVLLIGSLSAMPPQMAALALLAADPFSKMISSQMVQMLPYAWPDKEENAGISYQRFGTAAGILLTLQGIVPLAVMLYTTKARWDLLVFVPCVAMYFLYLLMWNRLKGYNGYCLSAVALLTELTFLIVASLSSVNL